MAVQIDLADELLTARIIGDIDHHSAKEMRETIDDAVLKGQVRELEIDFRDVTFMDSSGIGLILGRQRCARTLGGTLRIQHAPEALRRGLQLANIPCVGGESGETI